MRKQNLDWRGFSGVPRLQSREGKGLEMGQISTDRKRAGQGVPRQEA